MIPCEKYRYEIRDAASLLAIEEVDFDGVTIAGERRRHGSDDVYRVEATLERESCAIQKISLRYKRGAFSRSASYDAAGDFMRGTISAVGSRDVITTKLGRFREVDADLQIFRALTIAHIRARGASRWTGRVVSINSATLVAATNKQSCRMAAENPLRWIYEPRMGDSEEIEIDDAGRVVARRESRGIVARLIR